VNVFYLGEIVDMCVRNSMQSIDRSSESVNLLMRISNQDFPTALREHNVHDDWIKKKQDHQQDRLKKFSSTKAIR